MSRSEIEQDVRGLSDHELSGFQERRGEGRPAAARLHHSHHRGHAALAARDIGIIGAGLFQRETDIFTAALNAGPVIEFVAHEDPYFELAHILFASEARTRREVVEVLSS